MVLVLGLLWVQGQFYCQSHGSILFAYYINSKIKSGNHFDFVIESCFFFFL